MKITKYGHACVVLEEQGKQLVIDPGNWTEALGPIDTVIGVVITHNHPDHLSTEHLAAIIKANPGVEIFGAKEAAQDAASEGIRMHTVAGGQQVSVGPFTLRFYGEKHALIHESFPPVPHNVGVLVNDTFYYGGDSFTLPDGAPVKILATPASAPWMKTAEVVEFIRAVRPQICFPTHNALLSEVGQKIADMQLGMACDSIHAQYLALKPGDSFEA